jgi:hypothetical protein
LVLACLEWLEIKKVGFGLTGMAGMEEARFGLTGIDWNGESQFWPDWNGEE